MPTGTTVCTQGSTAAHAEQMTNWGTQVARQPHIPVRLCGPSKLMFFFPPSNQFWQRWRGLGAPCALGEDTYGAAFLPTTSPYCADVYLNCLLISTKRLVQECGLVNGGWRHGWGGKAGMPLWRVGLQDRTQGVPGFLKCPRVQSCLCLHTGSRQKREETFTLSLLLEHTLCSRRIKNTELCECLTAA